MNDDFNIETSSNDFLNISFKNKKINPTLKVKDGYFEQPYYQTKESLTNIDNLISFIKKTEILIRTDPDYKTYVGYIKNYVGLTNCSVLSNINDEMAPIEMHHGPILNLFDICLIITEWCLNKIGLVNTFMVAEIVLQEHFNNNIQVVMLAETPHQVTHGYNLYINPKQAWGNLNNFIEKYKDGFSEQQLYIVNKYLELAEKEDTDFSEILKLRENIEDWSVYNVSTYNDDNDNY